MKRGLIIFIVIAVISSLIIVNLQQQDIKTLPDGTSIITNIKQTEDVNLNKFIEMYNDGKFDEVELINGKELFGLIKIEKEEVITNVLLGKEALKKTYLRYKTYKPEETTLSELGFDLTGKTQITVKYEEDSFFSRVFLETMLPLLLIILLLVFLFRMFGPKGGGFPFGAQAGQLQSKDKMKVKFKDAAGMEETKGELEEIVDYLKTPDKYQKVGAKIPKGVLLYGPPGSGKTLLARAVAGEADVPFFTTSGSEFMEMLVGMGAAKVRDLFKKAKQAAPAIIFIDEIDTIGKKRGMGSTGGHQEQEQTLNQILAEMDGFEKDTNVIVLAATNRPDILDKALLRPGRFDRKVYVPIPTLEERMEILKIYTKDKKISKDVDLDSLARRTSGFAGADMENLANEAALKTAKDGRKTVTAEDFEYALEKIIMGPEKKNKTLKEKERQIITYHELGHAITAYNLPNTDPVEKISIVSRGMALGVTWLMPKEDVYLHSKAKFLDDMVTMLGGRAAEEIVFGKDEITTGANNDFEKVTQIATDMITKYGMDEEIGTISYAAKESKEFQTFRPYSESTTEKIDTKIQQIIKDAYKKATNIIKENRQLMDTLANILLEKEYLTRDEFKNIMENPKSAEQMLKDFEKKKKQMAEKTTSNKKDKKTKKSEQKETETEPKEELSEKKKHIKDILDRLLR